jgi:hypothetical protein
MDFGLKRRDDMQRIDGAFVLIGALYGAAGMGFGIWMGVTHNLQFANAHAHINLVGFVSFMLFGIVYRLWPALKERRLAAAHSCSPMSGRRCS